MEFHEEEVTMKNNKKIFLKGVLLGTLVTFVMGVTVTSALDAFSTVPREVEKKLELIQYYVENKFLFDYDEKDEIEGLYQGYMMSLGDPYTGYYTEEETKEMWESSSGEYSGVGALMSQDVTTGMITLVNVFPDSPAQEAGLKDGDILEAVDGKSVLDRELTSVVNDVKGEEGTTVEMTVKHGIDGESQTYTVTRRKVESPTVEHEMKEDSVGYIRVTEFSTTTLHQFEEAMEALEADGMTSLIIDLRNNPGGNVATVSDMLRQILPKGIIIYTEDKDGNREELECDGEHEFEKPMAVLVNGYSASASEIFAGAVKDYEKATIVGTTTFGKGIIQELIGLPDGTAIKVTTSEYFTPNGQKIHGVGIEPDVVIEPDMEDFTHDVQLEKAIEVLEEHN